MNIPAWSKDSGKQDWCARYTLLLTEIEMIGIVTGNDTGIDTALYPKGFLMDNSENYTIADIAKAAGVSVSTVSRILSGKQDVAPATRERVQKLIKEMGFVPHAQAQRLRAGKTRNVALLFPLKYPGNLPYNPLEMDFISGASVAAAEHHFFLNLVTTQVNEQELLNFYRSAQVDGLILMHIHLADKRVELLRQGRFPFVMIGHSEDNTGLNFIDLDFEAVVMAAFEHLVSLGHRNIGFLSLPTEMRHQGFGPAARAWEGYRKALHTFSLKPLFREVSYIGQEIYEATLSMLKEQPDLTAIITTHEFGSFNISQALRSQGREIPEDCSLVGLMTDSIAERTTPLLTYVEFPAYTMGYEGFNMLINLLEGKYSEAQQILLPPRLVLRNSTLPPG